MEGIAKEMQERGLAQGQWADREAGDSMESGFGRR